MEKKKNVFLEIIKWIYLIFSGFTALLFILPIILVNGAIRENERQVKQLEKDECIKNDCNIDNIYKYYSR